MGWLLGRSLTAVPFLTQQFHLWCILWRNCKVCPSKVCPMVQLGLNHYFYIFLFLTLKTLVSDIQKHFCACNSCKDSHPFDNPLPVYKMQGFKNALTSWSKIHSAIKLINTWKIHFWHCLYSSFSKCSYVVISQMTLPPPEIKTNPIFMRFLFPDFSIADHGLAVPTY